MDSTYLRVEFKEIRHASLAMVGYNRVDDFGPVLFHVVEDDVNEVGDVQWNCCYCTEPERRYEDLLKRYE